MDIVKDRVALISGINDGIGRAIAVRFAEKGAKVVIIGDNQKNLDELASGIKASGGNIEQITVDGKNSGEIHKTVCAVLDRFGRIDILINNAENSSAHGICNMTDDDWHQSLSDNLDPMFFLCREVIPVMREKKYGRVINISDLNYIGWPGKANYSAAKSAIFGFTRSLALEVAKDNITVNCVAKGDIRCADMTDEDVEKAAARLPVKKLGTPEDVALAVGFFASDTSPYATGQTLFVCGGKSMYFSMSI
jgi:3-oxoacyl-[acyl-carrier protein] reductase/2-[hydroxy(phenyl)methyl]-succinyl-CoA dehydrogenase BbsC subunit